MAFEETRCDTGSDTGFVVPFWSVQSSAWEYISPQGYMSAVDRLSRHILNDENRNWPDPSGYFNRASITIVMTEMKTSLQFDEKGDDFEYHEWRSHELDEFDLILGHLILGHLPEENICQEARQARLATKLWHTGQDKLLAEARSSNFSIKADPSIPFRNSKDDDIANFDESTDMARYGDWSSPSTTSTVPLSLQFMVVISLYNLWLYAILSNGLSHWSNLEINGVSPWSYCRSPTIWLGLVTSLVGILTPLLVIFMEAMLLVTLVRLEWSQMWMMDCCDEDNKHMHMIDWLYGRRSRGYILLNSLASLHLLKTTKHIRTISRLICFLVLNLIQLMAHDIVYCTFQWSGIRTAKESPAHDCFRDAGLVSKTKSASWARMFEALRVRFGARLSHKAVRRTSSELPHVTILCPTYDEDLKISIMFTLVSLRAAIAVYEGTSRSPSPFLDDDLNFLVAEHRTKSPLRSGQACLEENPIDESLLISEDEIEIDDKAQSRPSTSPTTTGPILRSSLSPSHHFHLWSSRARAFVSSTSAKTLNRISIMI